MKKTKTKGDKLLLENMLVGLISQLNHKDYDKAKDKDKLKR